MHQASFIREGGEWGDWQLPSLPFDSCASREGVNLLHSEESPGDVAWSYTQPETNQLGPEVRPWLGEGV